MEATCYAILEYYSCSADKTREIQMNTYVHVLVTCPRLVRATFMFLCNLENPFFRRILWQRHGFGFYEEMFIALAQLDTHHAALVVHAEEWRLSQIVFSFVFLPVLRRSSTRHRAREVEQLHTGREDSPMVATSINVAGFKIAALFFSDNMTVQHTGMMLWAPSHGCPRYPGWLNLVSGTRGDARMASSPSLAFVIIITEWTYYCRIVYHCRCGYFCFTSPRLSAAIEWVEFSIFSRIGFG